MEFKKLKFYRFFKVGELLHLIALISLCTFILFYKIALYQYQKGFIFFMVLYGYFAYLTFWITILAELDARSRFQNYKQLKDQIYKYGYQERLLRPLLNSRCQRDAAVFACYELGYKNEVERYFYNKGYRWYHIIPDFVFTHPGFLFTVVFWKTTFFVPVYKSVLEYN